ncbi:protein FAM8A1 isoform X1 [Microplitis mediator]|uniref:protein FAM8A1 isoform X1 n=1 Tax=Microplitis mediator TaxID=375433 RepID=UPI0025528F8B|nr:protein FAM8A1 isoform X1 [Microplitis mediator]
MSKDNLNSEEILTDNSKRKKERDDYFLKLEKWLQEAYAWQSAAATVPYYFMSGQLLHQTAGSPGNQSQASATVSSTTSINTPTSQSTSSSAQTNQQADQSRNNISNGTSNRPDGIEYHIPPIWKRFVAELIDSLMLFVLKLVITFVALDIFAAMNMEPYTLDTLQSSLKIVDYKMAIDVASTILIWELMHRFIVCVFEAIFIQHGMNGRIGGATPGKSLMGLRVVQCRTITPVDRQDGNEVVLVSPGTDLGLPLALGRSIVKNLIMTLVFPICFSLFSFRFNRTGYDLACHSIVVEDPYRNNNNNNNYNINNNNLNINNNNRPHQD